MMSYMHVATLALHYGQPPLVAYLLPLSIDGMVATSSLVMLRAARAQVSALWLARTGLVVAALATLAANAASGLPDGWPGALLAGWPAVAFVVSAETAISMSRRRLASGHRPAGDRPPATRRPRPAAKRLTGANTEAAPLATLATNPGMTTKDLAVAIGMSERTARRVRARLAAPDAAPDISSMPGRPPSMPPAATILAVTRPAAR